MAIKATYRIEEHDHGVLIFGSIPLDMMVSLTKRYPEGVLDPAIAEGGGASNAIAISSKAAKDWRADLDIRIDHSDWFKSGDTGLSSRTIYAVLADDPSAIDRVYGPYTPIDPSDFGRCYRLVKRYDWESRLQEVADRYPQWAPIVEAWPRLAAQFESEGKLDTNGMPTVLIMPLTYDLMQPVVEAVRKIGRK